MNDLDTILKNNSPVGAKAAQAYARALNKADEHPKRRVCSGRLPETEPKTQAAKDFLAKQPVPDEQWQDGKFGDPTN